MIFTTAAISNRRKRATVVLERMMKTDDVLLIYSGQPIQRPGGLDQNYPFISHPDYYWATGFVRPGGICVFSKNDGWVDFVSPVGVEEKIWGHVFDEAPGLDVAGFEKWLATKHFTRAFVLGAGCGTQSVPLVSSENRGLLQEAFNEVRRIKDAEEIALIESIAKMAHAGYSKIKEVLRPGVSEREIQVAYEGEIFRAGADAVPYETIVGSGHHGSILHALPTSRVVKSGEVVLIDAGAARHHYCVDITRVYSADGKFSTQQKSLYDVVLKAQQNAIAMCAEGVEWKDVHLASARSMAEGLRQLNILNVSADVAVETGAIGVFFPHGVGHLVGLHVRDVGGLNNPNPKKYAGARIRIDMPLKNGYLMTVEPGLYFIKEILNSDETRRTFKNEINWNEVNRWMDFGGIRIEDDIFIQSQGPKNLTSLVDK